MTKDSKEYNTPEEKVQFLLEDITTTLSQGKSDRTYQKATEVEKTNPKDLNDSKTRMR
jgi:hypothetical protein